MLTTGTDYFDGGKEQPSTTKAGKDIIWSCYVPMTAVALQNFRKASSRKTKGGDRKQRLNRKNQTNKAAVKTSKRKLLSYDQEQNENKGNKRVKHSSGILRCLVSEENSDSVPWEKWIPCTSCTWWARGC